MIAATGPASCSKPIAFAALAVTLDGPCRDAGLNARLRPRS
ncbi:MAG: hypothetical protein QOD83_4780 [Solirubrobacteraceae bacterium]|jgi:hypothetical protein|nr:hypothetical protein [Solirubrobacteraceae bacterium]